KTVIYAVSLATPPSTKRFVRFPAGCLCSPVAINWQKATRNFLSAF
ncbi:MAG: hypothetical protein ACI83E_002388, partial [Sulfitobacter sp.]